MSPCPPPPLSNVTSLLLIQGRNEEARRLYEHAIGIWETSHDIQVANGLINLAEVSQSQVIVGAKLYFGRISLKTRRFTVSMSRLKGNCRSQVQPLDITQGNYAEAESLYKGSLTMLENAHGPEHPAVATALSNRAGLLKEKARFDVFPALSSCDATVC